MFSPEHSFEANMLCIHMLTPLHIDEVFEFLSKVKTDRTTENRIFFPPCRLFIAFLKGLELDLDILLVWMPDVEMCGAWYNIFWWGPTKYKVKWKNKKIKKNWLVATTINVILLSDIFRKEKRSDQNRNKKKKKWSRI